MQFLIFLFVLIGCSSPPLEKQFTVSGTAMKMPYHVIIGHGLTQSEKESVRNTISKVFERTNSLYNHWNPDSELSKWNRKELKDPSHLQSIFEEVTSLCELTSGLYDPTIHSTFLYWKTHLTAGEIPTKESLKKSKDLQINLDGMIKGKTVDWLVEALQELGYENLFVDWSGDMKISGTHPEGRPWRIRVKYSDSAKIIELYGEMAVATSGSYEKYWQLGTETYSHFIDPTTLNLIPHSAQDYVSATIISPSCALSDSLATTAMLFKKKDEAEAYLDSLELPLQYILLSKDEFNRQFTYDEGNE